MHLLVSAGRNLFPLGDSATLDSTLALYPWLAARCWRRLRTDSLARRAAYGPERSNVLNGLPARDQWDSFVAHGFHWGDG